MKHHKVYFVLLAVAASPPLLAQTGGGVGPADPYSDFNSTVSMGNLFPSCISITFGQLVPKECVQDDEAEKTEQALVRTEAQKNLTRLLWDGLNGYIKEQARRIFQGEAEMARSMEVSERGLVEGVRQRTPILSVPSVDAGSQLYSEIVQLASTAPMETGDDLEGTLSAKAAALFQEAEDLRLQGNSLNDRLNDIGRRTGTTSNETGLSAFSFDLPDPGSLPLVGTSDPRPPDPLANMLDSPSAPAGTSQPQSLRATMIASVRNGGDSPVSVGLPTGIRPGSTAQGETVGFCSLPEDEQGLPTATEDARLTVELMGAIMASDATQSQIRLSIGESAAIRERSRTGGRTISEWIRGQAWTQLIK